MHMMTVFVGRVRWAFGLLVMGSNRGKRWCVDADANKQHPSAQVWASSGPVRNDASFGEREGRGHGRSPLSVDRGGGKYDSSSQLPMQSAGTKYARTRYFSFLCSAHVCGMSIGLQFVHSQLLLRH